jgi:hypothetical protein
VKKPEEKSRDTVPLRKLSGEYKIVHIVQSLKQNRPERRAGYE